MCRCAESYGQGGMALFRAEAARGGVCVARWAALRAAPGARAVAAALRRLRAPPDVAVCWCEGRTARALLQGLARRAAAGHAPLRLVASDGWADRRDVAAGLERAARHALTLRVRSPYLRRFDAYYHALTPHNNHRNPWFKVSYQSLNAIDNSFSFIRTGHLHMIIEYSLGKSRSDC